MFSAACPFFPLAAVSLVPPAFRTAANLPALVTSGVAVKEPSWLLNGVGVSTVGLCFPTLKVFPGG